MKTFAHTYTIFHTYRKQITLVVCATCVLMALVYAAYLYQVISRTVALQHVTERIASLSATVDDLDGTYLALSGTITPDEIGARGFDTTKVQAYISRTTSLGRATLGYEL